MADNKLKLKFDPIKVIKVVDGEGKGRVVANIFLEIFQKLFVPKGPFTLSNSKCEKRAKKKNQRKKK